MSVFDGWSYEEITTPTIDYYSLFEHGMGRTEAHRAFRFTDSDGRLLALRPDVTSSVARAAATLFAKRDRPLRLCYSAQVFQQNPQSPANSRRESAQIGCELVGPSTNVADLEILTIAHEVLSGLDPNRAWTITVNDVEIFNGVAERLNLSAPARDEMRLLVDSRNAADLEQFLRPYTTQKEGETFAQLTRLAGKRETLSQARVVITNKRSSAALDRLEALWSVIDLLGLTDHFEVDLGDVSRLDYYTGLTFKIYVEGAGSRVGSGGRYDGLTATFGRAEPAIGFVLDVDVLTETLLRRDTSLAFVGPSESEAVKLTNDDAVQLLRTAREIRANGEQVRIALGESSR